MLIKMRTTIANPKITAIGGSVIDVSESEGQNLIKAGYAEKVEKKQAPVQQPAQFDFSKFSVAELTAFAEKANLKPESTKKADLIKILTEANYKPEQGQ